MSQEGNFKGDRVERFRSGLPPREKGEYVAQQIKDRVIMCRKEVEAMAEGLMHQGGHSHAFDVEKKDIGPMCVL